MGKKIETLRWKCRWTSHLGCVKGCLEHLGIEMTDAWLFGLTGHAFIINVHERVCPSGPTAWNTEMLSRLGRNAGYAEEVVSAVKTDPDFAKKQELAWKTVRKALDADLPCYGWELEIPEFYVVYGYDDVGYYFSGPKCDEGRGPKPWREVGDTQIGCLEMYTVMRCDPAEPKAAVREALRFAVEHAHDRKRWVYPGYRTGPEGYDTWIRALKRAEADGWGTAYNAAVWDECRDFAHKFLTEAAERLGDPAAKLLSKAADHYGTVAENLKRVADAFPFFTMKPEYMEDEGRRSDAVDALHAARKAEAAGLGLLERIVREL